MIKNLGKNKNYSIFVFCVFEMGSDSVIDVIDNRSVAHCCDKDAERIIGHGMTKSIRLQYLLDE